MTRRKISIATLHSRCARTIPHTSRQLEDAGFFQACRTLHGRLYHHATHAAAATENRRLNPAALRLAHLIKRWDLPKVSWKENWVVYVIFVSNTRLDGLDTFYVGQTRNGVKQRFSEHAQRILGPSPDTPSKIYCRLQRYHPSNITILHLEGIYPRRIHHVPLQQIEKRATFLERKWVQILQSKRLGLNSELPGTRKRRFQEVCPLRLTTLLKSYLMPLTIWTISGTGCLMRILDETFHIIHVVTSLRYGGWDGQLHTQILWGTLKLPLLKS
jgi:hypothetical protein